MGVALVAVRPVRRARRVPLVTLAALTWALYGDHGELDATARLVLCVLGDHAGTEGVAWPSRQTMAGAAGVSLDTVDRRLRELVDAGVIRQAAPAELPAAWHAIRGDRRPRGYVLDGGTGPQPAAPCPPTGPQTEPTGPQNRAHGAAAVRHEPNEPNLERTRAGAREPGRPDALRPCPRCRHLHRPGEPCLRRQPADVAARGAAAARAALAERIAAAGMIAS